MKRTTKHGALDAHEATTVGLVREESGRVIARSVLSTDSPRASMSPSDAYRSG